MTRKWFSSEDTGLCTNRITASALFVFSLICVVKLYGQEALQQEQGSLQGQMQAIPQIVDKFTGPQDPAQYEGVVTHDTNPQKQQWFRDDKFGIFIHCGPATLLGTEISWSRKGYMGDWDWAAPGIIPAEVYDKLYLSFDPCKFDVRQWMDIIKDAGTKYVVFITKHHDGFCLFDTPLTDYDIMNTPFGRDMTAEVARACHEAGLKLGLYYSLPDWVHPDFLQEHHERFIQYTHEQLRDLCTKFAPVKMMWFDGGTGGPKRYDSCGIFRMLREISTDILINNRGALEGDYYTPEQQVGTFDTYLWESCVTIGTQWSWKPGDTIKSGPACIRMLVQCAGGDGNLLLNVSPMPSGQIEPRQVDSLRQMGAWLRQYGQSIYGTRGGPFKPARWGVTTQKSNTIYVHVLEWNGDEPIRLSPIKNKIVSSSLLTGGNVDVKQGASGIEIHVSPADRNEIDTIVALELDGPAHQVPIQIAYPSGSAALNCPVTTSAKVQPRQPITYAVDDDLSTYWLGQPAASDAPCWIEVDLGKPVIIDRAFISESHGGYNSIDEFEILYAVPDSWQKISGGTKIGFSLDLAFEPLTAQKVRLNITKSSGAPVIREFQLFQSKP